jgi:hypothetical protein
MERLLDALGDPVIFRHLYAPPRRSVFNEYMYQTGAKQLEIYAKLTQRFEAAYDVQGKHPMGPKHYHMAVVPEPKRGPNGRPLPQRPGVGLPLEGTRTLLLMGSFFFNHLRLYDAGQELLESALLILFQARSFDVEIGREGEAQLQASAKAVPTVVEVAYALAKAYALRLMAQLDGAIPGGLEGIPPTPGYMAVYEAYQSLTRRPSRPRGKAPVVRSTYELFLVEELDVDKVEQVGGIGSVARAPAREEEAAPEPARVAQREKLKLDPAKL